MAINNFPISELDDLLFHVETIFDGWHSDGTAWSEWDESVRQRLLDFRIKYTYMPNKEQAVQGSDTTEVDSSNAVG